MKIRKGSFETIALAALIMIGLVVTPCIFLAWIARIFPRLVAELFVSALAMALVVAVIIEYRKDQTK